MVSTAAFHARVRGSVPGLGGFKETKMFLPHPRVKVSIVGSLRDREVACSASDRQGSNFESCVWRTVSSHSSHHPQDVLLAQFSLYVHKGGLKPDSFHFLFMDSARWLSYLFGGSPSPASTLVDLLMQRRRVSIRDRMRSRVLAMYSLNWSGHAALSWANLSSNSPSAQSTSPAVLTPSCSWPRISDIISRVLLSEIPIFCSSAFMSLATCIEQRK